MKTTANLRKEFWKKMSDSDSLCEEYVVLKNALAYAIKTADGWHDDSHGGPVDTSEMKAARKLLK